MCVAMRSDARTQGGSLRLIALDLDGTLLRSDGSISARTRVALDAAERAGLVVMSVTARPPRRVARVAEATGLRGVAICSNGGLLYDVTTETVVSQIRLSAELTVALVTQLRSALPGVAFAVEVGTRHGSETTFRILEEHGEDRATASLPSTDALVLCREGVTKLIVQHPEHPLERLLSITSEYAGTLATVTYSGSEFVEVSAAGVTKASALAAYCAQHNIEPTQVIACGDMPNDLPMLSWAGWSVAVANAHPQVLACADEVTDSNDEDGVAAVLERLAHDSYAAPIRKPRKG